MFDLEILESRSIRTLIVTIEATKPSGLLAWLERNSDATNGAKLASTVRSGPCFVFASSSGGQAEKERP